MPNLERPMFIPLKTAYYEAFLAGTKTTEYRVHGKRWNAETCRLGRKVVLSKGYGTQNRRTGVIAGFEVSRDPCKSVAWQDCYGTDVNVEAACIHIKLDEDQ